MGNIQIVRTQWLLDCIQQWERVNEADYLIELHPDDVRRKASDAANRVDSFRSEGSLSSSESADDNDNSDDSEDGDGKKETEGADDDDDAASEDEEDLIPPEPDHSAVEDFRNYDWAGVEEDLAEYLGSDNEDSDDANSNASESTAGTATPMKRKRSRSASQTREAAGSLRTNGNHAASPLAKRQQLARTRSTGLKTVSTPRADDGAQGGSNVPVSSGTTNGDDEAETPEHRARREELDKLNDEDFAKELELELMKELGEE
jgi:RNA polymerase II subunit A-like phosphatase